MSRQGVAEFGDRSEHFTSLSTSAVSIIFLALSGSSRDFEIHVSPLRMVASQPGAGFRIRQLLVLVGSPAFGSARHWGAVRGDRPPWAKSAMRHIEWPGTTRLNPHFRFKRRADQAIIAQRPKEMLVPGEPRWCGGHHPVGDAESGSVCLPFNPQLRVEFRGATVTSDAGLLLPRELAGPYGLAHRTQSVIPAAGPLPASRSTAAWRSACCSGHRLQLRRLLRRRISPLVVQSWSLTSLRRRLFEPGAPHPARAVLYPAPGRKLPDAALF
jgi:hypothetical protein